MSKFYNADGTEISEDSIRAIRNSDPRIEAVLEYTSSTIPGDGWQEMFLFVRSMLWESRAILKCDPLAPAELPDDDELG